MRINELSLENFRGFKAPQKFQFGGEHALITGGNGAGKSSALEAVEFILNGEIDRLHGPQTKGISAKQHLPNRYASPSDVYARAKFRSGDGTNVTASRRFTDREPDITPESPPAEFDDVQRLVDSGLHKLTRSDMVDLVVSTPTDRGSSIDNLLDLEEIDERRKQLRRLRNQHYSSEIKRLNKDIDEQQATLRDTLGISDIEDSKILAAVSEARETLGGGPLDSLGDWESLDFRRDLQGPDAQEISAFQREDVKDRLQRQAEWFEEAEAVLLEDLDTLESLRQEVAAQEAQVETGMLSVLERGQSVIDDSTESCPLCGTTWDPQKLNTIVEQRKQQFEEIANKREKLQSVSESVLDTIQSYISLSESVLDVLGDEIESQRGETLRSYLDGLQEIQTAVKTVSREDAESQEVPDLRGLAERLPSADAVRVATQLQAKVEDQPAKSQVERAWETLSVTESALSRIAELERSLAVNKRAKEICTDARDELVQARTEVLEDRYASVEATFKEYYESINPDEADINVELEQTNAGVKFRVGFYGDGVHPPHAMHSEGHQDLMGICLFLALSKELSEHQDRFVLLDDVVMSIDEDHREEIAELFQGSISDEFQFIITTHDEVWKHQLQRLGVIPTGNQYELDWDQQNGTVVRN